MMLYTKYESSGPCSFRQQDFFSCEVWLKSNVSGFRGEVQVNKRALGRSPEEKVKGHSDREPQGQNLNNFGRGPFDDVIY